jgi:tetratricopeptide (TPR) repeat protein
MIDFAEVLFSNGFNSEAMKYFNQAKKINPENERLAMWLSVRNMTNESISVLNEQLERNPDNVKILLDAVLILQQMGKKEAAMKYFIKLKRLTPSSNEVKKVEAIMAEAAGEHDKSLALYEDAFKSDPKDLPVIKTLAGIYIRRKLWDKVILHYRTSLEYYPNEPFLLEGLGRLLISSPDQNPATVNEGREYSERAYINYKSTFSTKIAAARNLATAYAILGDKKKTLEYINITLDLAKQGDSREEYISYFEDLKAQFNISK